MAKGKTSSTPPAKQEAAESILTEEVKPVEQTEVQTDEAPPAKQETAENSISHSSFTATSTLISTTSALSVDVKSSKSEKNTVTVLIQYPEGYDKPKYFKNGDLKEVSKEAAEDFIKRGIATLVDE